MYSKLLKSPQIIVIYHNLESHILVTKIHLFGVVFQIFFQFTQIAFWCVANQIKTIFLHPIIVNNKFACTFALFRHIILIIHFFLISFLDHYYLVKKKQLIPTQTDYMIRY